MYEVAQNLVVNLVTHCSMDTVNMMHKVATSEADQSAYAHMEGAKK